MSTYIGLIRKEPGSCYGVEFPDFPGCISGGDTLEEAMEEAADALGFHIRGMMKDGESIPEPSALEHMMAKPENAGTVAFVVKPKMRPKGKSVRLNVTLDEHLLADIDAYAGKIGKTRSAFLADAAKLAIGE